MTARDLPSGRVMVISPHLDDAVLSCGDLIGRLTECVVLTIFAGNPGGDWSVVTPWDSKSGFGPGIDVVQARIEEDKRALAYLDATAVHLQYIDSQYRRPGDTPFVVDVAAAIESAITETAIEVVFCPLGISHADHVLVSRAAEHAAWRVSNVTWLVYQDLPYGYSAPSAIAERLNGLHKMVPEEINFAGAFDVARKEAAMNLYESQMRAIGAANRAFSLQAERYWQLRVG